MNTDRTVNDSVLDAIVQRILQVADPAQIILFGSAARGELGPDSDIDVLVITAKDVHRRRLAAEIRHALRDIPAAFDIVVATTNDVALYGESPYTVLYPALREGKVIYAA